MATTIMKWTLRALTAIVLLVCVLVGALLLTALSGERPVGFAIARATPPAGPPFAIGVWYPTEARPKPTTLLGIVLMNVARDAPVSGRDLPLVVISHGNGGGPQSHADLAMALAGHGYVVAAPLHTGDNYVDASAVGSATFLTGRSRQFRETVDYLLADWSGRDRIDRDRIGAFGFSAGGFTVLTAVGAQPDLRRVATHCAQSPEFACDVLRQAQSPLLNADATPAAERFASDPRIKAAVVAAPGLGFTIGSDGVGNIRVPVQLWSGDADRSVPYATNTGLIREGLGSRAEFHPVAGAGHFSFLTPCGLLTPISPLCAEQGSFDRKAFHQTMNASVVAFFGTHLQRAPR